MKVIEAAGQILFLVVRGLMLWGLIPFAFLAWLLVHSWAQRASLRQATCWYDANVTLLLAKGLLRPQFKRSGRVRFLGLSRMRGLPAHKIHWFSGVLDLST